jgi:mevalonate kinase
VFTNGNQMQIFEFTNAGIDYTNVIWTLTGGGLGGSMIALVESSFIAQKIIQYFKNNHTQEVWMMDLQA